LGTQLSVASGLKIASPIISGDVSILPGIKYVITVDEDTKMPYDSARYWWRPWLTLSTAPGSMSISNMSLRAQHTSSSPELSMPEADRSRFVRLFGGEPALIHTHGKSRMSIKTFGEGSLPQGIYDVDAFSQSLGGRFPDN